MKKEKRTPKNSKGKKVAKGKCYHCNQDGHWLRNCPKYLVEKKAKKEAQGKYDLLALETYLVEYDSSTWILDLWATNYIYFSFHETSSYKACRRRDHPQSLEHKRGFLNWSSGRFEVVLIDISYLKCFLCFSKVEKFNIYFLYFRTNV